MRRASSARSRSTRLSTAARSPKSWETWAKTVARRLPVRGQGLALLRDCARSWPKAAKASAISSRRDWPRSGPKLGPILWQFAARRQVRPRRHRRLHRPASRRRWMACRCATPSSRATKASATSKFFELCRDAQRRGRVRGFDDEFPCIDADTADFAYARLQRMREEVPTGYDDSGARQLRRSARAAGESDGRDGYVFMINGAKVRAPAAALALQERLR